MKTTTSRMLDQDVRPIRSTEESIAVCVAAAERKRMAMDFNPLMARAMLAQKMADKHMYVPTYDERDRERGF